MITEDYVSFETAKLLKEKGFDEKCSHYWQDEISGYSITRKREIHKWTDGDLANTEISSSKRFSAPTLQMAMKWLREIHNIYIDVLLLEHDYEGDYGYVIENTASKDYIATSKNNSYNTPEEACEPAIKYCLENLI